MSYTMDLQKGFTTEVENVSEIFEILKMKSNFSLTLILVTVCSLVGRLGLGKCFSQS